MSQKREQFNRFNSTQAKQKNAIAEISKSVVSAVAIELANARCRNNVGESNADGSCSNQNQGAIEPATVKTKYNNFSELDVRVVEIFVDFSIVIDVIK